MANTYLDIYEKNLIKAFRRHNTDVFNLKVFGLSEFIDNNNQSFIEFIQLLKQEDFLITFEGNEKSVESLKIEFTDVTNKSTGTFYYQLVNLISIIEFASRTNLSLSTILVMRIVSNLICKYKILYKAIVIDLDETLWPGILSEDGPETISDNLHAEIGKPFVGFMNFVKIMAKELGIFVAICSRNDSKTVKQVIDSFDDVIFPIKSQIDCIVANDNEKSLNISAIAERLHILPESIVFVDDNQIERDKVKSRLPEVVVLDWNSHYDLITQINACCLFDRYELSKNSQNRKGSVRIINIEKEKNTLPRLLIEAREDIGHVESKKLYSKSNQFKFNDSVTLKTPNLFFLKYIEKMEKVSASVLYLLILKPIVGSPSQIGL